ncbi:DUF4124 domain-containing protein [Pseudomonas sp. CAU 1711]|uniref:DUF4124 domain-containing protein n=1 Tax=Pseudomonas sp. CAU 1711 TaxID=3140356 RepID=UPI00326000CE
MRPLLPALVFALLSLTANAGVYTYIDADGNRVFTDQPPSGSASRIELAPSNAMPANKALPTAPPPAKQPPEPSYQILRILTPTPDSVVREASGDLIVTADSEPGLHPGHGYRLILDGQPQGQADRSPVFPLKNLDRGTHQISVEILDAQGRIVERTPAQPFHLKRISLAEKRRTNPCKKKDWGVRPECPIEDKPKDPPKDIPLIPFI